ncbi:hypothetical protein [Streptomyces sp. NRRL S-337]|uniref:hypothetical protein n=1 Tax=Streptomyces sp. NRRL S-337 TaxID=1463900 RepID=UPI0004CA535B
MLRDATGTALTCTAAVEGLAVLGLAAAPNSYVAGLALTVCGAGMGATMVLGPSLRQAIVPAHLMGPLYTAAGLLLTMTTVTATMTSNRRVEAALRAAAPPMIRITRNPGTPFRSVPFRAPQGR